MALNYHNSHTSQGSSRAIASKKDTGGVKPLPPAANYSINML